VGDRHVRSQELIVLDLFYLALTLLLFVVTLAMIRMFSRM
jgi:hypothetical protein